MSERCSCAFVEMYELDEPELAQGHEGSGLMDLAMRIVGGTDADPWGLVMRRDKRSES